MHDKTQNQNNRIIYLYRITCLVNQKIYIGQTVDPTSRWRAHRRDSADPKVPIQFAIKKHGTNNFDFEVIATCKGQDNANELETFLVTQYNSYVSNNKGYNATHGGMNAPKSEAWHKAMDEWRNSLSIEERAEISKKQAEATINQIVTQGHPAQGIKWTDEQKTNLSITLKALDKEAIYTEEVRQRMSVSHLGIIDSEETKRHKSISATIAWEKRISYDDIKCQAPDCDICGKAKYKIIEGVRYCNKHGLRMLRYGRLDRIKH